MWICAVSHEVRFGLTSAWLAHNTETASDSWSGTTNTKYNLVALTFVHRFFFFFFNVALFIYRWLTCSLILCWEKKCIFLFYDIQHAKYNLTLTEVLRHHSVFSLLHPSAHYQLSAHFGPQDNSTFKSQRPIQQLSLHWWIACAWGAECNLPLYHNQSLKCNKITILTVKAGLSPVNQERSVRQNVCAFSFRRKKANLQPW